MEKSKTTIGLKLMVFLISILFVAFFAGIFTNSESLAWYEGLKLPMFTPPAYIFKPVWMGMYLLMAVSGFWVSIHNDQKEKIRDALIYFGIQLAINAMWSMVFFGFRSLIGSFILLCFLTVFLGITLIKFIRISEVSAVLLVPYIMWTAFSCVLALVVYIIN